MHVTACLAGQDGVDVEVGEECRSLQALKEAIVEALPKLCVEGFNVSVGGRALDDDKEVVSLQDGLSLDVVLNTRGLGVRALREAGRAVSEEGLLEAAAQGDVSLVTLYLDAGVPIDCVDCDGDTPLHLSCEHGHLSVATLLLDRGTTAIDEQNDYTWTPLHVAIRSEHVGIVRLLLDRGTTATHEKSDRGYVPLHYACVSGSVEIATLLLDRGSAAIDETDFLGWTPLHYACKHGKLEVATLLLDRGSTAIKQKSGDGFSPSSLAVKHNHEELCQLLTARITEKSQTRRFPAEATDGAAPESTKRRRVVEE